MDSLPVYTPLNSLTLLNSKQTFKQPTHAVHGVVFFFQKREALIKLTTGVITDGTFKSRNYGIYTENEAGTGTLDY